MDAVQMMAMRVTPAGTAGAGRGKSAGVGGFGDTLGSKLAQTPYDHLFIEAGARYGISPAVLKAVACAESGFNPDAVSGAGAVGLMQIMPETARVLGIDPRDPAQSVDGAARLLRSLMDRFDGDLTLALAGYNAGPGAVSQYNGVPPYRETENYIKKVTKLAAAFGSGGQATPALQPAASPAQEPGEASWAVADAGDLAGRLLLLEQLWLLDSFSGI